MIPIFQAEMDGTCAGMSSAAPREVPPQFARRPVLAEAWLTAFDKMRESLRGTPVEAEKGQKAKTVETVARKPREKPPTAKPQAHVKPSMMAILENALADAE